MTRPRHDICIDAFGLAFVFALGLSLIFLIAQRQTVPQALPPLAESVNPNTAPVASLLCLPGIGPVRAQAIVTYRQTMAVARPERTAFETVEDLMQVKGLGPGTVDAMRPWLAFGRAAASYEGRDVEE